MELWLQSVGAHRPLLFVTASPKNLAVRCRLVLQAGPVPGLIALVLCALLSKCQRVLFLHEAPVSSCGLLGLRSWLVRLVSLGNGCPAGSEGRVHLAGMHTRMAVCAGACRGTRRASAGGPTSRSMARRSRWAPSATSSRLRASLTARQSGAPLVHTGTSRQCVLVTHRVALSRSRTSMSSSLPRMPRWSSTVLARSRRSHCFCAQGGLFFVMSAWLSV